MAATVGAAFGGNLAVTASSGPGICLKGEAMGLGMITELPMVIVDVQRGGPSTGLPTKTEQSDLLLAMFGRNGECPLPDCWPPRRRPIASSLCRRRWRIAVEFMAPVIFLSDGYIANGAEPWRIPEIVRTDADQSEAPGRTPIGGRFLPYKRDERLRAALGHCRARPAWMHRIGGLEKQDITGNVEYSPANHQHMAIFVPPRSPASPTSFRSKTVEGPKRANCWCSVGAGPTGGAARPCARFFRRGTRWRTAICVISIRSRGTWKRSSADTKKCWFPN